jgi:hypothetical protein
LVRLNIVETEIDLYRVREGGFALNFTKALPEIYSDDRTIGFSDGKRGSFIKSLMGFRAPESVDLLLQKLHNSNTLGGKSVIPTIFGGRINPGKHIYLSASGTWFGSIGEIKKFLNLISDFRLEEDNLTIVFNDQSCFQFVISNYEECA